MSVSPHACGLRRPWRDEGGGTSLGVLPASVRQPRMTKDLADHVRERSRRVDHHSGTWDVFLCPVESDDEVTLGWFRSPLVLRALVEPPVQGFEINVEDEHLVELINELREVARASAEERDGLLMV